MVNSVKKAMDILKYLSGKYGEHTSLKEISNAVGVPKSTCVNLLNTLAQDHYVERVSQKQGYIIGHGVFYLTRFGNYRHELSSTAHPVLKWLQKKTGHTVVMCVFSEGKRRRVCIDYIVGTVPLSTRNENILLESAYKGASSRVLLANLPEFELREMIEKQGMPNDYEWNVTSIDQMKRELSTVKKRGFAETVYPAFPQSDVSEEQYGYARPVFLDKRCIAAIGLVSYERASSQDIAYLKKAIEEVESRIKFTF